MMRCWKFVLNGVPHFFDIDFYIGFLTLFCADFDPGAVKRKSSAPRQRGAEADCCVHQSSGCTKRTKQHAIKGKAVQRSGFPKDMNSSGNCCSRAVGGGTLPKRPESGQFLRRACFCRICRLNVVILSKGSLHTP